MTKSQSNIYYASNAEGTINVKTCMNPNPHPLTEKCARKQ